jgi:hypothetical protein
MTYPELIEFIEKTMSMSHVYQPLLIRALVDAGGSATVRHLAQSFLCQDESQPVAPLLCRVISTPAQFPSRLCSRYRLRTYHFPHR